MLPKTTGRSDHFSGAAKNGMLLSCHCGLAAAEEAPRGLEGDLERAFGLAGEAERDEGLVDGMGSGERLPGDLVRPAAWRAAMLAKLADGGKYSS